MAGHPARLSCRGLRLRIAATLVGCETFCTIARASPEIAPMCWPPRVAERMRHKNKLVMNSTYFPILRDSERSRVNKNFCLLAGFCVRTEGVVERRNRVPPVIMRAKGSCGKWAIRR
jgi:hypothetical protein